EPAPAGVSNLSLHVALPICAWDPEGVLNPGTLGFRGEPATPVGRAPLPGGEAAPHERPLIQVDRVSQLVDVDAGLTLDELENLQIGRHTSELQSRENLVCRL